MTSPYFTYYYSKAFDTVYRKNVFETKVKIGETIGESFNTHIQELWKVIFSLQYCLIKPIKMTMKGFLRTPIYLDVTRWNIKTAD